MIDYKALRKNVIKIKLLPLTQKNYLLYCHIKAPVIQIFHCLLDNAKYSVNGSPPIIEIDVIEQVKNGNLL
jgi:hypothetical protein